MVDSWGELPNDLMKGNFFDLGTFSQCFHIKRNGIDNNYKTQYCIAQLKFRSNESLQRSKSSPWFVIFFNILKFNFDLHSPFFFSIKIIIIRTQARSWTAKYFVGNLFASCLFHIAIGIDWK